MLRHCICSVRLSGPFYDCMPEQLREGARLLTLEEIEGRSLWVRLRDALFWLFTPYL